jgi:hypothetical protein
VSQGSQSVQWGPGYCCAGGYMAGWVNDTGGVTAASATHTPQPLLLE